MAELLPDRLGVSAGPSLEVDEERQGKNLNVARLRTSWNGSSATAYIWPCLPKKHQTGFKICWGTKALYRKLEWSTREMGG